MTAVARPIVRPLPLVAAGLGFAALALSLTLGPRGAFLPIAALGGTGLLLLAVELGLRTRDLLRRGLGFHVGLVLLGAGVLAAAWSVVVSAHLEYLGLTFSLGLGGTALVMLGVLRTADEAEPGQTPWQALAGGPSGAATERTRFRRLAPLLSGVIALLVALRILVGGIYGSFGGSPDGALGLTIVLLGVFAGGSLWALRVLRRKVSSPTTQPAVARDEQVVAAHLHDSVLQTLALIQRNAADAAKVATLARQQERGLRSWLAGRDEPEGATFAAAVRLVARGVEDEQTGAVIDVVVVGDAPLDAAADAMVQAAREAMRNAVRHAGGPVEVYLEVEPDGARQLFVRDSGGGFDLATVSEERRGVRDAIIGRMEHAGGTAAIETGPGGTEVTLALPAPADAAGDGDASAEDEA